MPNKLQHGKNSSTYEFVNWGTTVTHVVENIPGKLLLYLEVILYGTLNVTASGGVSGVSHGVTPGGIVDHFELECTPKSGCPYKGGVTRRFYPSTVLYRRQFDRRRAAEQTPIDGTVAVKNILQRFMIPIALPSMVRPIESSLKVDQFTKVKLRIVAAGGLASMLVGTSRGTDVSQLQYEVIEHATIDPNFWPRVSVLETDFVHQITRANDNLSLKSELQEGEAYTDLLVYTRSGGDPSDAILNKITLDTDGDNFWGPIKADRVRLENSDYKSEAGDDLTGLYYFPIADGMLSNTVDNLNIRMDVNNPGVDDIVISSRRVIPLPKAFLEQINKARKAGIAA